MYNPAYCEFDCSFFISESPLVECSANPEPVEWSDEEIAAICTVLHRLTAIRIMNPTDAEDLVQDTILTMLTKYSGFRLHKGLLVWCMGILRKKVGNYYRKAHRLTTFSEQDFSSRHAARDYADTASPESKLFQDELQRIVNDALAEFPSPQRKALELLMTGMDSGEVVKVLHPESYQNVINRIHRGRKRLAKELAKYGYGPNVAGELRKMKRCRKKQ